MELKDLKRKIKAEYNNYKKNYETIINERIKVLQANNDALAYTSVNNEIYISYENDLTLLLSDKEKVFFRRGLFVHEMLHKKFTNFIYLHDIMSGLTFQERKVFLDISNIIEDGSIEYHSSKIVGGLLLKSLKFMVAHVYNNTPEIQTKEDEYSQFFDALLMFSNLGIVKGNFTFEISERIFKENLEDIWNAIKETSSKKRMDYCLKLLKIIEPLWKKDEESEENMMNYQSSMPNMNGNDVGDNTEETEEQEEQSSNTDNNTSDSNFSNSKNNSTTNNNNQSNKEKNSNTNDSSNTNDNNSSSNNTQKDGKSINSSKDNKKAENEENENSNNNSSKNKTSNASNSNNDGNIKSISNESVTDLDNLTAMLSDYLDISDFAEQSDKEIELSERELEVQEKLENAFNDEHIMEYNNMPNMSDIECKNILATASSNILVYENYILKYKNEVNSLTNVLREILANNSTSKEYKKKGRLDINRTFFTNSPNVFTKKESDEDIDETGFVFAIDNSGSMCGGKKLENAIKTVAIFSEILSNLDIPVYVFTYVGDVSYENKEYDALHTHYIRWNNTLKDRSRLLTMNAQGCNFDGYSIRYAKELFKGTAFTNKNLIVISDGLPNSSRYENFGHGITDCENAVEEVLEDNINVIGVGLDIPEKDDFQRIYKNNCLMINDIQELYFELSKKIKQLFYQF